MSLSATNQWQKHDTNLWKTLKNKADIAQRLVQHERNNRILNTKGAYYYVDNKGKHILLSGLLPCLKKTFFPDTNIYNLMKTTPQTSIALRQLMKSKRKEQKKKGLIQVKEKKASKGRFWGRIRGTMVHTEIEDFITFMSESKEDFLRNFLRKRPGIHVYTRRILTFIMETMNWLILRPEFDIYDETLKIGTSFDIICVNRENGKLVLLEVKCGFKTYFDNHDSYMRHSLSKLTNSMHHQANIQLITASVFLIRNHRIPLDSLEMYVIRVDDDDLHYYRVHNEYVAKKGMKIYNDLLRDRIGG